MLFWGEDDAYYMYYVGIPTKYSNFGIVESSIEPII